jgi:hypothetical protein
MKAATYRLVVNLAGQRFVYPEQVFDRFNSAQARIADAVRQTFHMGRVTSVEIEQRIATSPQDSGPAWAAGEWMTVQCWGTDVVDRILSQAQPATATVVPTAGATLVAAAAANLPDAGESDTAAAHAAVSDAPAAAPSRWPAFRRTRYALAGSAALLATVMLINFLWQAEGHPVRFLAVLGMRQPVLRDLPFHASALPPIAPQIGVRAAQTD